MENENNITLQDVYDAIIMPNKDNQRLTDFIKMISEDLTIFAQRDYEALGYAPLINPNADLSNENATTREGLAGIPVTDSFQEAFNTWNALSQEEINELNTLGTKPNMYIRENGATGPTPRKEITIEDLNLSEQQKENVKNFLETKENYINNNRDVIGSTVGFDATPVKDRYPNLNIKTRKQVSMDDVIARETYDDPIVASYHNHKSQEAEIIKERGATPPPTEMIATKEFRIEEQDMEAIKQYGKGLDLENFELESGRAPDGVKKDNAIGTQQH